MQLASFKKAQEAFKDHGWICIPYLGHAVDENIIFMEFIDDQMLNAVCQLSYNKISNMRLKKWRDRIYEACFSTGQWLHHWHNVDKQSGRIDLLLEKYINNRLDILSSIDKRTEFRLYRMISQAGSGRLNATHGDFTPSNVMWSEQRLTVFDFGISEWEIMSPWWDAICMDIGLRGGLAFSYLSPGKWNSKFIDGAVEQFWHGYANLEENDVAKYVCIALRHLVLYNTDNARGRKFYKRAKWHNIGFKNALYAAENL